MKYVNPSTAANFQSSSMAGILASYIDRPPLDLLGVVVFKSMMNLIIWNIQGIAKANTSNCHKNLIRTYKLDLLPILEPMVHSNKAHRFVRRRDPFN